MTQPLLRILAATLASCLALFSFSSCESLPTNVADPAAVIMEQVTAFTGDISGWQSGLQGLLGDTDFAKLEGYASKARELGSSLGGITGGLEQAMADPVGAISSKLSELGGLDVGQLKQLAPQVQSDAVSAYADQAASVGTMAKDFLAQFGS